jgi:hypothetical protein
MKRSDILFVSALAVLGSFVGREALHVRHQQSLVMPAEESFGATHIGDDAPSLKGRAKDRNAASRNAVPEIGIEDTRRRLELGSGGTYIGEILAARDSALARWPDRRDQPLRVWVQPTSHVADWNPASVAVVREAFFAWADAGVPLQFTFVLDSSAADVHVSWIDRFKEQISGKTLWAHDAEWWIVEANITLAVHHKNGDLLDDAAVRAIALHEVGHLIGLDHTSDTTNIMTPRVRVRDLSAADRSTARLLYMLPPGPVGGTKVAVAR